MKTIAEMQHEIRSIRDVLTSLDNRLNDLDKELLNHKDGANDHSEYQRIYEIAKSMPVIKHPLMEEKLEVKNNYFAILLMIAVLDDSISDEQLLFLQRIVMADSDNDRIDYYLGNLGTIQEYNVLLKMNNAMKKIRLGESLILDMMILTNLSHGDKRNRFKIIANIACFLGKSKDSLRKVARVARVVLQQDKSHFPEKEQDVLYWNSYFGYYLSEIKGWNDCVELARSKYKPMDEKTMEFLRQMYLKDSEKTGV